MKDIEVWNQPHLGSNPNSDIIFCQWESSPFSHLWNGNAQYTLYDPGRTIMVKVQQSSESGRPSQTAGLVTSQQTMSLYYLLLLQQEARWEGTSCLLRFPRTDLLWPIWKPSPTRKMKLSKVQPTLHLFFLFFFLQSNTFNRNIKIIIILPLVAETRERDPFCNRSSNFWSYTVLFKLWR